MVFPGRFSTGCSRCRQRKVKCDEGKPSCRRCYIYGKPCPGYSDQFRFRHTPAGGPGQGQNGHDKALTSPSTNGKSASKEPRPGVPQEITFSISTTAPEDTDSPIETASTASSSGAKSLSPVSTSSTISSVSSHLNSVGWRRPSASKKQQQRRQSRQDDPSTQLSLASLPLDKIFPKILPQPELSYDEVSMSYFVSRFVSPDGVDDFPGHLSWLPTLFDHYNHQGPLELATLSVAQMAAFTKFGAEKFKVESLKNHGRALKALQSAIQDEETAKGDKILGSVLLLCAFNDISGEGLGDPSNHASGLYYLLEKRGFEQLLTRRGLELFLLSLIRLQVYSFLHGDARYCDPGGMGGLLGEWDPLMRAMYFMSRVHVLRNELAQISLAFMERMRKESPNAKIPPVPGIPWQGKKPGSGEPEILEPREETELLDDCFNALQDLDQWDVEAQQYWSQNYEMRTCPTLLGNIGKAGNRYDLESACVIVLVRTVRHILLLTLLEHLHRMNILTDNTYGATDSNGVILTSLAEPFAGTLRLTIDDILACVPFALGDIGPDGRPNSSPCDGAGALVILHPLRLVTYSPYATAEQTTAGQDILMRLNQTMGIKAAKPWDESDEMTRMKWAAHFATPRGLAQHLGKDLSNSATVEYIEGKGGLSTGINGLTISPQSTSPPS